MIATIWAWLTDPANWSGAGSIPDQTLEHLRLSFIALAVAALIAIPIGLYVGHTGRGRVVLVNLVSAFRAIPSLGVLFIAALLLLPRLRGELADALAALPDLAVSAGQALEATGTDTPDPRRILSPSLSLSRAVRRRSAESGGVKSESGGGRKTQQNQGFSACLRGKMQTRPVRFERTTFGLGNRCSILLSYGRIWRRLLYCCCAAASMLRRRACR